mgnify:CR=1 FL=1
MVGHSERRHVFGESNIEENKKMLAAMKHGFTGLLCIGETKEEKGYGIADEVLRTQIKVGLHGIAAEDLDKYGLHMSRYGRLVSMVYQHQWSMHRKSIM